MPTPKTRSMIVCKTKGSYGSRVLSLHGAPSLEDVLVTLGKDKLSVVTYVFVSAVVTSRAGRPQKKVVLQTDMPVRIDWFRSLSTTGAYGYLLLEDKDLSAETDFNEFIEGLKERGRWAEARLHRDEKTETDTQDKGPTRRLVPDYTRKVSPWVRVTRWADQNL